MPPPLPPVLPELPVRIDMCGDVGRGLANAYGTRGDEYVDRDRAPGDRSPDSSRAERGKRDDSDKVDVGGRAALPLAVNFGLRANGCCGDGGARGIKAMLSSLDSAASVLEVPLPLPERLPTASLFEVRVCDDDDVCAEDDCADISDSSPSSNNRSRSECESVCDELSDECDDAVGERLSRSLPSRERPPRRERLLVNTPPRCGERDDVDDDGE